MVSRTQAISILDQINKLNRVRDTSLNPFLPPEKNSKFHKWTNKKLEDLLLKYKESLSIYYVIEDPLLFN